jgi:hypothetical protein
MSAVAIDERLRRIDALYQLTMSLKGVGDLRAAPAEGREAGECEPESKAPDQEGDRTVDSHHDWTDGGR